MDVVIGILIGIGLSAACGFRIFVPLLGMSIANMAGHLTLSSGLEWIGTWPALITFAMATVLEVGAYCMPWVDNIMDMAATPAAIVAGTIVTASQVEEMSPLLKWSLALIVGGGVCGVIQAGTVVLRGASSVATAGFGNFIVSFVELVCAVGLTALTIVFPFVCLLVIPVLFFVMISKIVTSRRYSTPPVT